MTRLPLPRRQAGLTLVELMISMVIGMIIVLAVITAYISASRSARLAEATGRMNEDAQAALTILTQQLRMAGANPAQPDRNTTTLHNVLANPFSIRGCDHTFSDVKTAANAMNLTCPTSGGDGNASISIGYEADRFNTVPTSGRTPTDCLGNSLPSVSQAVTTSLGAAATVTVYEAENRFFIGTSTYIASPSLYCKGNSANSTNAQPLVENIEQLRIAYGVSNPARAMDYGANSPNAAPNFILGYLSAGGMLTSTVSLSGTLTFTVPAITTTAIAFLTPSFSLSQMVSGAAFVLPTNSATVISLPAGVPEAKVWEAVKAARICVLVRSEGQLLRSQDGKRDFTQDLDANPQYVDCDGNLVTAPDRRLRRAYTATVVLRNQSP
jgi:type IV pilus assembly protein PilW